MKNKIYFSLIKFALVSFIVFANMTASLNAQEDIDLDKLVELLRRSQSPGELEMKGIIRRSLPYDRKGKIRFKIFFNKNQALLTFDKRKETLRFEKFADKILIHLNDGKQEKTLDERDYAISIYDSDLTAEDLAFGFLYWNKYKLISDDAVAAKRIMNLVEFENSDKTRQTSKVRIWVDKKYIAIARIEYYDSFGNLLKKMIVTGVHKVNKVWMPKQIRIELFTPKSDGDKKDGGLGKFFKLPKLPIARSYIDFYKIK